MSRFLASVTAVVLSLVAAPVASFAEPPNDVTLQGQLLDATGVPLSGPVTVEIGIWDAPVGGAELYRETHADVALVEGVFDLLLGTGDTPSGPFDAALFVGRNRWLEIAVEAELLEPRQPFSSVAYSLQAAQADTAADAAELGGLLAAAYQRRVSGTCLESEAIRMVNADGSVECSVDSDTQYSAGDGLQLVGATFSLDLASRRRASSGRVPPASRSGRSTRTAA